jgi:MoaA/NifB/PqqE/SkfB family radical SAM enzyme
MQQLLIPAESVTFGKSKTNVKEQTIHNCSVGKAERSLINFLIKLHMLWTTCRYIRSPRKIIKVFKTIMDTRKTMWNGNMKKMYKVDGKYYYNMYAPGWPSKSATKVFERELQRMISPDLAVEKPSFIFLGVTRKCPMRCEHCLEWDNLNEKESFTKKDLLETVRLFQELDVLQIHFSGGEPMVRIKDLLEVISYASKKSDCWVLTSGFNFTDENAAALKKAGCHGVVISVDHHIPEMHNFFRGHQQSFQNAMTAIKNARKNGLVTSVSVCATKQFLDGDYLLPYLDFMKAQGVQFIQILEPRNIGHYKEKDVMLEERHINLLEKVFSKVNHTEEFADYPTLLYHGFHQRRMGCFAGSRSVYIDSAGDVHACPFCPTKSYNIIDLIHKGATKLPQKENACPRFGRVA